MCQVSGSKKRAPGGAGRSKLQLTDSVFPTGAFAHSFGLETYIARGLVHSATGLEAFISNTLLNAAHRPGLPFGHYFLPAQ